MARIEFDGQGFPIPKLALPPFGSESDLPPTTLTFTDNADFSTEQYIGLGFTHFEVWAVGAAGGRGGGIQIFDPTDRSYDSVYLPVSSYGGEGGGGGLHRISGLLEDLPSTVPVIVGKRGLNGADGNKQWLWRAALAVQDFAGVPTLALVVKGATNIPGMVDGAGNAIAPYFYVVDSPYLQGINASYVPPQDATDGGYSSFGALCQASGGRGGKKSPVYYTGLSHNNDVAYAMSQAPGGAGGEGGVGGRTAVGGGGLGAKTSDLAFIPPGQAGYPGPKPWITTEAKDGTWTGSVGQGGGGGLGGTHYSPPSGNPNSPAQPPIIRIASKGGRGSFSYGDTSVHGQAGYYSSQIVPGTAGGARPVSNLKVGSRTPAYSPDGIVVLRLTRIV